MRNHSYENDFDVHENETACRIHFHMKGFALRLGFQPRHKRTRKWPIEESKIILYLESNSLFGTQLTLPLSREEAMIPEAAQLDLHQNENLYGHGLSMAHVRLRSKCCLLPAVTGSEEVLYSWALLC